MFHKNKLRLGNRQVADPCQVASTMICEKLTTNYKKGFYSTHAVLFKNNKLGIWKYVKITPLDVSQCVFPFYFLHIYYFYSYFFLWFPLIISNLQDSSELCLDTYPAYLVIICLILRIKNYHLEILSTTDILIQISLARRQVERIQIN